MRWRKLIEDIAEGITMIGPMMLGGCKKHTPLHKFFNMTKEEWEQEMTEKMIEVKDAMVEARCGLDVIEHFFEGEGLTETQYKRVYQFLHFMQRRVEDMDQFVMDALIAENHLLKQKLEDGKKR